MNKELKEILDKDVSELDLVKTYMSYLYPNNRSFVLHWWLSDGTIEELNKMGVIVDKCINFKDTYTRIQF